MKKRYMVGLFFIFFIIFVLIVLILWNRHKVNTDGLFGFPKKIMMEKKQDEKNQLVLGNDESHPSLERNDERYISSKKIESRTIKEASNNDSGYYIMEKDGYVCIYKAQDKSLYYQSDILIEDLPLQLQEEIRIGKYIGSELEVYHFLESYSS